MTPQEHIDIITHSLGLTNSKKPYRNRYCANSNDTRMTEMVQLGLMEPGHTINEGRSQFFHVTDNGAKLVKASLPKD